MAADTILPALVSQTSPGVDVLFLDTGYHFPETIGTRDALKQAFDVTIVDVTPQADGRRAGRRTRQGPLRP